VTFAHLLKERIYREIEIARLVLRDLGNEGEPPHPYAIKTLQHHTLWTHAGWPAPLDDQDTLIPGAYFFLKLAAKKSQTKCKLTHLDGKSNEMAKTNG
jgi:hypothetical protein